MVEKEVAEALYGSACGSGLGTPVRPPKSAEGAGNFDQEFWIETPDGQYVRVTVACFGDHPDDL